MDNEQIIDIADEAFIACTTLTECLAYLQKHHSDVYTDDTHNDFVDVLNVFFDCQEI